jgi:hypothetical protein
MGHLESEQVRKEETLGKDFVDPKKIMLDHLLEESKLKLLKKRLN